jgi:hypothetical protein
MREEEEWHQSCDDIILVFEFDGLFDECDDNPEMVNRSIAKNLDLATRATKNQKIRVSLVSTFNSFDPTMTKLNNTGISSKRQ